MTTMTISTAVRAPAPRGCSPRRALAQAAQRLLPHLEPGRRIDAAMLRTAIHLAEGILFTTYATLRSDGRNKKISRVAQIVQWLGSGFNGAIIFDEKNAMQNVGDGKGERGDQTYKRLEHRLSAYGLFHEIISWKLRMLVPTDANGPAILAKVLERYPLARVAGREAA